MYGHIKKLNTISEKEDRLILGLMSGTSLDGLDIALCKVNGSGRNTKVDVLDFITMPYDSAFRQEVRKVFSKPEGSIELLVLLHAHIGRMHGHMIMEALKGWGIDPHSVDLIASHGQTIFHAPQSLHKQAQYGNATLQIGDGDHIAMITGIITLSDFRMKHIAAGGEGAPLAVYGDLLMFGDLHENRVLLNIGGIANFTWLPNEYLQINNSCFSTDIGPGNTMMDAFVQLHKEDYSCDKDAIFAKQGKVSEALLHHLSNHPFFEADVPKTIGPELFNMQYLKNALSHVSEDLKDDDVIATLNKFTADGIVDAIKRFVPQNVSFSLYASGGGVHNPVLMDEISKGLPQVKVGYMSELGVSGDAKEALLFAVLANECVAGKGLSLKQSLVGVPDVSMGKISLPG
jgi:anhydro-N-acetylmuramic acid kinase